MVSRMKKLSLVLLLVSVVAAPAWAGGQNKNQGSGPKNIGLQKLQGLNLGGHGSQSSPSVQHAKPFKHQGITAQNLVQNQNQNLKPLKVQGITAQNLVPNRRPNMLKGTESVNNTLPVTVSNTPPSKPGFVWTGSHWQRAPAASRPAGTGNGQPLDSTNNFLDMANNPPPVVLTTVKDPPKPGRGSGGHPNHGSGPNGGVTVNWRPGSQRPADVIGVGASPIDNFFSTVGSSIGSDFQPGKLTRPAVSDHR